MKTRTYLGAAVAALMMVGTTGPYAAVAVEPATAPQLAPQAPAKARPAKVTVVLKTPEGVAAQAVLNGRTPRQVAKDAAGTVSRTTVKVSPGRYRVKPAVTVADGVSYAPTVAKRAVKVTSGSTTRVRISWAAVRPPAGLEVLSTTRDSVQLAWASGKGVAYELRRTTGEAPPTTRTAGERLYKGTGTELADTGLQEGGRYAYALWTQVVRKTVGDRTKKVWVGPTTKVAGTVRTDPVTGGDSAAYSLSTHALVVDSGDADTVRIAEDGVWVTLAGHRPAPVLGAGMTLPASETLPGGYIGTIAELAPGGRTVRLAPAGIGDVFDHFEVSGAFESDPVDFEPVEYGTYDPATDDAPASPAPPLVGERAERRALPDSVQDALAETTEQTKPKGPSLRMPGVTGDAPPVRASDEGLRSCFSYNASDLRVGIDPTFDATGDFDVLWHKKTVGVWKAKADVPYAASVDVSSALTVGALFDVEIKKELSCLLGLDDFYKQVTAYPVPMGLKYSGGLEIRGYGKLSVKDFGFRATAGYDAYLRLGLDPDSGAETYTDGEAYDPVADGEIGMEAALTGEFTFGPAAGTEEVGVIAGVHGQLDVAKVGIAGQFGDPAQGQERCLDISFGGAAELNLKAEAWAGALEASKSFALWDGEWDYVEPFRHPARCVKDDELGDGDVRATLRWSNGTDYDLHVTDPSGEHIYYRNSESASGGALDHDIIPGCATETADGSYVENVNWQPDTAPAGSYQVWVHEYRGCEIGGRTWSLEVTVDGRQVLFQTGSGTSEVFEFQVPGGG